MKPLPFFAVIVLTALATAALLLVPPWIEQNFSPEHPSAPTKLAPRQAEAWPAPIWSARCKSQHRTMIAHQADGGPWVVACTGPA